MSSPATKFSLDPGQLAASAGRLPPAPQVFGRLLAAVNDGNCSLHHVAEMVRVDPSLAAQLLRVANSAIFGFRTPAVSVEEAILRVGLREVQRIVALSSASLVFRSDLAVYATSAEAAWENAVVCAVTMEQLAMRTCNDPAVAYTAGLLRSIGKVVLARHATAKGGLAPYQAQNASLRDWELQYFATTHAQVGFALCELWKFPRAIGTAVRDYLGVEGNPSATVLAHLLGVALAVAARVGHALPGELPSESALETSLARTGLAAADLQTVAEETGAALDRTRDLLKIIRAT